jgi:hypothetical protein
MSLLDISSSLLLTGATPTRRVPISGSLEPSDEVTSPGLILLACLGIDFISLHDIMSNATIFYD